MSTFNLQPKADPQPSLLDLLQNLAAASNNNKEGSSRVLEQLQAALRTAIKASPLSRHQIAGEMSHLVGETITAEIIDSWTREKDPRHIPAEFLPAFCLTTGSRGPIEVLGRAAGAFVLPGPEVVRAEIRRWDEVMAHARKEKQRRVAFLKEIEK